MNTLYTIVTVYGFALYFGLAYLDTIGHHGNPEYQKMDERTRVFLHIPGINVLICAWMIICTTLYFLEKLSITSHEKTHNNTPDDAPEHPEDQGPV